MRIRDWSSDVCSSDLESAQGPANFAQPIRGCVDGEGIGTRCVQTLLLRLGYRRRHGFDQLAADDHGIGAGVQALRAVGIADTKAHTHRYRKVAANLRQALGHVGRVGVSCAGHAFERYVINIATRHLRNLLDAFVSGGRGQPEYGTDARLAPLGGELFDRTEEHTSELQSLMRISYACLRLNQKI